jgi:hypothetical protein
MSFLCAVQTIAGQQVCRDNHWRNGGRDGEIKEMEEWLRALEWR